MTIIDLDEWLEKRDALMASTGNTLVLACKQCGSRRDFIVIVMVLEEMGSARILKLRCTSKVCKGKKEIEIMLGMMRWDTPST